MTDLHPRRWFTGTSAQVEFLHPPPSIQLLPAVKEIIAIKKKGVGVGEGKLHYVRSSPKTVDKIGEIKASSATKCHHH